MFSYALIAAVLVALLSLIGVFLFGRSGQLVGAHRFILPAAIGIFLGVVLFELIPETVEMSHEYGPIAIAVGFLGFYLLSRVLDTYHHHHTDQHDACVGSGARMLLIGDAIHNVADGVVIASAFLIDPALGIATTVGVALHEIPQEIAEFGVLVRSGFSTKKAALYNLLSASSIVLGVVLLFLFNEQLHEWLFVLTGLAAGNLLYIATADLIPELRESHKKHFLQSFIITALSLIFIVSVLNIAHEVGGEEHGDEEALEEHLTE